MYLFNWLLAPVKDDLKQYELLADLVVFGVALASKHDHRGSAYVFTPIRVAASDVVATPALIALPLPWAGRWAK